MCNFTPKKVHKIRGNKSQERSKKEVNTKVNEKKINLIINYFQANIKGKNKEEENWKTFKNRENILPEKKNTLDLPSFSALKSTTSSRIMTDQSEMSTIGTDQSEMEKKRDKIKGPVNSKE